MCRSSVSFSDVTVAISVFEAVHKAHSVFGPFDPGQPRIIRSTLAFCLDQICEENVLCDYIFKKPSQTKLHAGTKRPHDEPSASFSWQFAMSDFGLQRAFAPRSLALVGGSPRPSSLGAKVLRNLCGGGFAGEIAVANPNHQSIGGLTTFPNLSSLPFVPDLIVITTPAPSIPDIVREAGKLRVA